MHRAFALAISTVALTWAGSAAADPPNIRGAFGFTGTAACLVAPGGVPISDQSVNFRVFFVIFIGPQKGKDRIDVRQQLQNGVAIILPDVT